MAIFNNGFFCPQRVWMLRKLINGMRHQQRQIFRYIGANEKTTRISLCVGGGFITKGKNDGHLLLLYTTWIVLIQSRTNRKEARRRASVCWSFGWGDFSKTGVVAGFRVYHNTSIGDRNTVINTRKRSRITPWCSDQDVPTTCRNWGIAKGYSGLTLAVLPSFTNRIPALRVKSEHFPDFFQYIQSVSNTFGLRPLHLWQFEHDLHSNRKRSIGFSRWLLPATLKEQYLGFSVDGF